MTKEAAKALVAKFEAYCDTLCEGYGEPFDEALKNIDVTREKIIAELCKEEGES